MHTIAIRAWGPQALCTTPHLRADPYTLAMLSPSGGKGILRSIYWKPEFEWEIVAIHLLAPIRYSTSKRRAIIDNYADPDDRTIQVVTILVDVNYVIEARIVENPLRPRAGDHRQEFLKRARRGEQYTQPHFGQREYIANWELLEGPLPSALPITRRLGSMPLDNFPLDLGVAGGQDAPDSFESIFFRATLDNGVMRVPEGPYATRRERTFAVRDRAHVNLARVAPNTLGGGHVS